VSRPGLGLALVATLVLAVATSAPWAAADDLPQIHTVAGGGSCSGVPVSGGPCDDKSATSVPIGNARGVAALPAGGFLYVDSQNDVVREVTTAGKVITVAGDGTATDAPDGTLAVDSGLNDPVSVSVLPAGGFLITESAGSVVRVVSPGTTATATITTIAGTGTPGDNGLAGQATAIQLRYPSDAEPTAGGGVLIADTGNDLIRLVSAAAVGATLTTIAGGGGCDDATTGCEGMAANAVGLHEPVSVSPIYGGAGGYLIAENDYAAANAIRQVSAIAPSATFTTVAGVPGQQGAEAGDGGPATAALLNVPEQVVSLPGGGFLIADTGNDVIREVSASGVITTVAGDGFASYAGDGGDATAASLDNPSGVAPYQTGDGDLLIADEDNGAIREVTIPPTTAISLGTTSLGLDGWYVYPVEVAVTATEGAKINCEFDPPAPPPAFAAIEPGCALTGAGSVPISGNGPHTVWAASENAAGDVDDPVSLSFGIDQTSPVMKCTGQSSFRYGTRHAKVEATVSDRYSGPVRPIVSAPADTLALGSHRVGLTGENKAGTRSYKQCGYDVLPLALKPAPAVRQLWAWTRTYTQVKQLVVTRVPARAEVDLTCTGIGCPFSRLTDVTGARCGKVPCVGSAPPQRERRAVDLTALVSAVKLKPDDTIVVSIVKPDTIGRAWAFMLHSGRAPTYLVSCPSPGRAGTGGACAAPD
jgi:hypothetical protein